MARGFLRYEAGGAFRSAETGEPLRQAQWGRKEAETLRHAQWGGSDSASDPVRLPQTLGSGSRLLGFLFAAECGAVAFREFQGWRMGSEKSCSSPGGAGGAGV